MFVRSRNTFIGFFSSIQEWVYCFWKSASRRTETHGQCILHTAKAGGLHQRIISGIFILLLLGRHCYTFCSTYNIDRVLRTKNTNCSNHLQSLAIQGLYKNETAKKRTVTERPVHQVRDLGREQGKEKSTESANVKRPRLFDNSYHRLKSAASLP